MPRSTGIRLRYQQQDEDVARFFGINLDFLLQAELLLNTVWTDVTMSCFFGGANEMFFTWQVSSLFQETFCITFTHYTSFSRHAEPGSLFSGAEIDVHVIRHNLLQKAILIFGLDSVGMDISVSGSVAVVWSRLKTHKRLNVLLWNLAPIFIFVRWLCRCHCLVTSVFLSIVQFPLCFCACRPVCFPSITSITPWLLRSSPSPEFSPSFFHLHPLNSLVSVLVIRHLLCLPTVLFSYLFLIFFIVEIQSYLWWTGLQINVLILVIY